jgi:hypothetical protein
MPAPLALAAMPPVKSRYIALFSFFEGRLHVLSNASYY